MAEFIFPVTIVLECETPRGMRGARSGKGVPCWPGAPDGCLVEVWRAPPAT